MKKLICLLITAVFCLQIPSVHAISRTEWAEKLIAKNRYTQAIQVLEKEENNSVETNYLIAQTYHQRYLKEGQTPDFYRAQAKYEEVISADNFHRKGYEGLIELLLDTPAGLSANQNLYRSSVIITNDLYEPKRKYKKGRAYLRYGRMGYKYVENPYYEIDNLVIRTEKRFRVNHIKYDKEWLSRQYVQLAKAILATGPDNPSGALDRALILADRAFDLDRSSPEARNLRNTFRQHHN
jgi:hypothetical protein